jgi:branched-chain amino acid transport system ATP-binding protein
MLEVSDIEVAYGEVIAVQGVSFRVEEGEAVCIVGSNGAGKTSILKTLAGLLHPRRGEIKFMGQRIDTQPAHRIVEKGMSLVPEGRGLFGKLSAERNLYLGAYTTRSSEDIGARLEIVYELYPVLRERRHQRADTLSGGEQQMLAVGRGLMAGPKLLMLDEPSLGLAPKLVQDLLEHIGEIRRMGTTILLVEQNVRDALELSDRGYVLQTGRIVGEGTGKELLATDMVREAYLGL